MRRVSVRRLFMLFAYLFRICFGVGRVPTLAREWATAVRRAFRMVRAIPARSPAVILGIDTRVPTGLTRAAGDVRRTEDGLFELELEGPSTASISARDMIALPRVTRDPVPSGRRLMFVDGTRRVVSRTMFAPRVRATLRTTTLRDALRVRVRVKNPERERGDMRMKLVALGRVILTPGMFASARVAISAALGVGDLKIAPTEGDMKDAARVALRAGFPERNGSFRMSVNDGNPALDTPFLRRYAVTLFVLAPR